MIQTNLRINFWEEKRKFEVLRALKWVKSRTGIQLKCYKCMAIFSHPCSIELFYLVFKTTGFVLSLWVTALLVESSMSCAVSRWKHCSLSFYANCFSTCFPYRVYCNYSLLLPVTNQVVWRGNISRDIILGSSLYGILTHVIDVLRGFIPSCQMPDGSVKQTKYVRSWIFLQFVVYVFSLSSKTLYVKPICYCTPCAKKKNKQIIVIHNVEVESVLPSAYIFHISND